MDLKKLLIEEFPEDAIVQTEEFLQSNLHKGLLISSEMQKSGKYFRVFTGSLNSVFAAKFINHQIKEVKELIVDMGDNISETAKVKLRDLNALKANIETFIDSPIRTEYSKITDRNNLAKGSCKYSVKTKALSFYDNEEILIQKVFIELDSKVNIDCQGSVNGLQAIMSRAKPLTFLQPVFHSKTTNFDVIEVSGSGGLRFFAGGNAYI